MNLNSILGPLEKIIIEHGSAVIQERHISLLKSELAVLEKRIAELDIENTALNAKIEIIETKFKKSQIDNEELRTKIKQYENASKHPTPDKAETDFDVFNY